MAHQPETRNTTAEALSHIHPNDQETSKPETILPDVCWVNAINWEFDEEQAQSLQYHTPVECPANLTYNLPDSVAG